MYATVAPQMQAGLEERSTYWGSIGSILDFMDAAPLAAAENEGATAAPAEAAEAAAAGSTAAGVASSGTWASVVPTPAPAMRVRGVGEMPNKRRRGSASAENDDHSNYEDDEEEEDDDDDEEVYSYAESSDDEVGGSRKDRSQSLPARSNRVDEGKSPKKRRRRWLNFEDALLREHVAAVRLLAPSQHKISWAKVAVHVPKRNAKQCRDRWQSIQAGASKREWTMEEDLRLLRLQRLHQNRWVHIAKAFNDRNDNMLKSRFRVLKKFGVTEDTIQAQLRRSFEDITKSPPGAQPAVMPVAMHLPVFQAPTAETMSSMTLTTSSMALPPSMSAVPPMPRMAYMAAQAQAIAPVPSAAPAAPAPSVAQQPQLPPGQDKELAEWCSMLFP